MGKLVFGYWDIRGRAEHIRLLLHYLKVDYEERTYTIPKASDWMNDKFNLGLDFSNLPYLLDGDFKITESMAIPSYICDKFAPELNGRNSQERALVQMFAFMLYDLKVSSTIPMFSRDIKEKLPKIIQDTKAKLSAISKYLEGRMYLVGDQITWVDFFLYEFLDFFNTVQNGVLNEISPVLQEYRARIQNLPGVRDFETRPARKSQTFIPTFAYHKL